MTPEQLLDLIIDRAPKLRAVGVLQVSVEGASFTLSGNAVAADEEPEAVDEDDDMNPLDDPETFGMRKGRKAPRFRGEQ